MKCNDKCESCEARELCKALHALEEALEAYKPTVKSDEAIEQDVEDFIAHMLPVMNEGMARRLLEDMDAAALQGMAAAALGTLTDLHLSWNAKRAEIDRLKVQLEAQEVLRNG